MVAVDAGAPIDVTEAKREAQLLFKLSHPNVLRFFGAFLAVRRRHCVVR
jgi:hypothetical protein